MSPTEKKGVDARPLSCKVPNCPNTATWRCVESRFRYCDTHKRNLGAHGFDKQHQHKFVKFAELTPEEDMKELSRKKTLLCFETQEDRKIAAGN